jgi:hypothetical protein
MGLPALKLPTRVGIILLLLVHALHIRLFRLDAASTIFIVSQHIAKRRYPHS